MYEDRKEAMEYAEHLARVFLGRCDELRRKNKYVGDGSAESAAVQRASMELTRSLVDVRTYRRDRS